jgi:hypothetical protein
LFVCLFVWCRYFDATELLPSADLPEAEFAPIGSRHDAQIHVLGRSMQAPARLNRCDVDLCSPTRLSGWRRRKQLCAPREGLAAAFDHCGSNAQEPTAGCAAGEDR